MRFEIGQKLLRIGTEFRTGSFRAGLLTAVMAVGTFCAVTSCIYDSYDDGTTDSGATTTIGLNVRVASTGSSNYADYEDGSVYENYIDISGGDYRIYFFTNSAANGGDDTFIAQFDPAVLTETDGSAYTWYYMRGDVPDELRRNYADFKLVILANWGADNYPSPAVGTTKLSEICTPGASDTWGKFSCKTDFELSADNLIPFYGVQSYTGIEFLANQFTELEDPIHLVRAMAKIEVVLDDIDIDLESVVLHGVNAQGYCAPEGVYSEGTYVKTYNSGWYYNDDDFDLHLVNGGYNDSDSIEQSVSMQSTKNDSGNIVWYCYVPEYRNTDGTAAAADAAYIQINPSELDKDLKAYRVYFRNYTNGSAEAGTDYDIGRNVLYRFTVSINDYRVTVIVDEWEDHYDNEYDFGDTVE